MALAVASYTEVANYYTNGAPDKDVTGVSWSTGDMIVVVTLFVVVNFVVTSVTNANLTFTEQVAVNAGGTNNESQAYIHTAIAASSQTAQAIKVTPAGTSIFGASVYVISGSPSGVANASGDNTETAFSKTVSAGSVCIYAYADWNGRAAGRTIATGSGTATERRDNATSSYGQWIGDWVGVSAGTFSFGVTSYTSPTVLKIAHAFVEVLAPSATVKSGFFNLMRAG